MNAQEVIEFAKENNVKFINNTDELPNNSIVMLSAHGTAPKIEEEFKSISLTNVNSVCPLVTKVHHEAKRFSDEGHEIIYWTARGGTTGINWSKLSQKQLDEWNCKYTRFEVLKKPSETFFQLIPASSVFQTPPAQAPK